MASKPALSCYKHESSHCWIELVKYYGRDVDMVRCTRMAMHLEPPSNFTCQRSWLQVCLWTVPEHQHCLLASQHFECLVKPPDFGCQAHHEPHVVHLYTLPCQLMSALLLRLPPNAEACAFQQTVVKNTASPCFKDAVSTDC